MPSGSENSKTPLSNLSATVALLRRLEWRARLVVQSSLGGEYKSSFRGKGMEFDQVVKYEFGDDVRDIDWNVTARLGEAYRKKFIEEREITLLLLFEDTPSLQFGSGEVSKRDALLELASLLMLLSAVNGDRISLLHATPQGYTLTKSASGRGRIMHTAANLLGHPAPPALRDQDAKIPWKYVLKAAPRHSIFVWLGDFPNRKSPDVWPVLRRRYQPMGFRISDPWENELPKRGSQPVYDPASGELYTLNGGSSPQRAAHKTWKDQRDTAFETLFPQQSDRLSITAGDDILDAVSSFFPSTHETFRTRMIEILDTKFQLANPYWLTALLALPFIAWMRGRRAVSAMVLPFSGAWRRPSFIGSSRFATAMVFVAAVCMILALTRPHSISTERHSKSKGYDIILAIDLSFSMEAEDYFLNGKRSNRLQAVKPVLSAFINRRENDRIGLVAFSGRAYTAAPLTFDHKWLAKQSERLQTRLIEGGTAIGDALAVATSRLLEGTKDKAGEREGAFIVLLTDGENTAGMMPAFRRSNPRPRSRHSSLHNRGRKKWIRPYASLKLTRRTGRNL